MKEFSKYSRISGWTISKYFGTWSNALEKSGYSYSDDAYRDLKKAADLNNGQFFSYGYYRKNGGRYSFKLLKKYLKCADWKSLLENNLSLRKIRLIRVVKVQNKRKSLFTEEQLFLELDRIWKKLGKRPTYLEFRKMGNIGTKVYERRFGSWTKAIEAFSLKYGYYNQSNEKSWVTPGLLLAELKEIASKTPSQIITFDDYKKLGGIHSRITFQNHFGSWAKAVQQIGKKDGVGKGLITSENLFAEIQRIWERLGRQPKKREMAEYGSIPSSLYEQRFGSWIKAIYAFCADRDKVPENQPVISPKTDNEPIKIDVLNKPKEAVKAEKSSNAEQIIEMKTSRTPSLRLRFNVFKRDGFKCVRCGRSPSNHAGLILEVDHIKPYSTGGETVYENLQTLCSDCNRGKSNLSE
jgi:hypothetical protein